MPISNNWKFLLERVEKTTDRYRAMTEMCETVLKSMWLIDSKIFEKVKGEGKPLCPSHSFVSAYFRRNIIYLHSSYIVASMEFSHPSICLQRTAYETILKGYLFIVNPEEANVYYSKLQTNEEERFLKKRRFYGHNYLVNELFEPKTKHKHRRLYKELCISAHAEIKGTLLDFPRYTEKEIGDRLKMILSLAYGNLQMMAENFLYLLDATLKRNTREVLKKIVESLERTVPLFEPDREVYSSKLRLKKGNFMDVLS